MSGSASGLFGYMQNLMERQMALKEAMMQSQLRAMEQERQIASEQFKMAQERARMQDAAMRKAMRPGLGRKVSPQKMAQRYQAEVAPRKLAHALTQGGTFGAFGMAPTQEAIEAIGIPAAHQGLMQSGRVLGQLGGEALRTAQPYSGSPFPVSPIRHFYGGMGAGGEGMIGGMPGTTSPVGPTMPPQVAAARGYIKGRSAEKGGRVPKTGTYKLHKDEIVLNKQQSDALFPSAKSAGIAPPLEALGKPIGSYQEGSGAPTPGGRFLRRAWEYLMTPGSEIPLPGPPGAAPFGVTAGSTPEQTDEYLAMRYGEGDRTSPVGPGPEGFTGPPEPPPLDIEGLEIGEASLSERRLLPPSMFGSDIYSRPETEQKTVKEYTLTGKKETDEEKLSRNEADAAYFGRTAEYYQQKADALLEYLGENPDPEVMKMYRQRQAVADRYHKRADQAQGTAEKLDQQLRGIKQQKELQDIEGLSKILTEREKAQGALQESQRKQAAGLSGEANELAKQWVTNAKTDEDRATDNYMRQMHQLFAMYKPVLTQGLDMSPEEVNNLYQSIIGNSLENPEGVQELILLINGVLS
jgi:hypothetical protein